MSTHLKHNPLLRLARGLRWTLLIAAMLLVSLPAIAATPREDLDAIRDEVDSLIESLSGTASLSRSEVAELRRDLNRVSRRLDALRERLGPGGGGGIGGSRPNHPGGDWTLYQQAESDVWPTYAAFEGWQRNRKFTAETDDEDGTLHFLIDNVDYTSEWSIREAYVGDPQVTVDPMATGDIYLTVKGSRGSREFLIKNGGIGPLYTRRAGGAGTPPRGTNPPASGDSSMAWAKPYYDLIRAGQISESPGTQWFIQQVEDDRYAGQSLANLGRYLSEDLPEQVRGEIAVLKYTSVQQQTKRISIPDPRNSVAAFVYAMDKAYGLYQNGTSFTIEMT